MAADETPVTPPPTAASRKISKQVIYGRSLKNIKIYCILELFTSAILILRVSHNHTSLFTTPICLLTSNQDFPLTTIKKKTFPCALKTNKNKKNRASSAENVKETYSRVREGIFSLSRLDFILAEEQGLRGADSATTVQHRGVSRSARSHSHHWAAG